MHVTLTPGEMAVLFRQDPRTQKDGGFQGLLVSLEKRIDRSSGHLDLTPDDLEKIPRYAFDYKNGGWEDRLMAIFSRELGPKLGR
jgi:hypothetical protein